MSQAVTDVREVLLEVGVPASVAAEVAELAPDAKRDLRVSVWLGLSFVGVMVLLWVVIFGLAFPDVWLNEGNMADACKPDLPANLLVSTGAFMFGSIFAAGWIMTIVVENVPLRLRMEYLAGSFLNENAAPYSRWFNKIVVQKYAGFQNAEEYFGHWNRTPLPVYRWPTIVLFAVALLSFYLVPATCI